MHRALIAIRRRTLRTLQCVAAIAVVFAASAQTADAAPVIGTRAVNIRSCASTDCDIVAIAPLGADVSVTGPESGGFLPVSWNGKMGFAYGLYLNTSGDAPWLLQGEVTCRQVALIFNIGIGYAPSRSIVDTLVEREASATMFPMGWWAEPNREYLIALDQAGFAIGTHGDQQRFLTEFDDALVRQDLLDSRIAIESVLGKEIDQISTPYAADTDERIRSIVAEQGFLPVGWKVAGLDYGPDATKDGVYASVMDNATSGSIVELHLDGPATEQSTALALPRIVDDLRMQGYELVTIPEMAQPCGSPAVSLP